jgi:hypothetical protein
LEKFVTPKIFFLNTDYYRAGATENAGLHSAQHLHGADRPARFGAHAADWSGQSRSSGKYPGREIEVQEIKGKIIEIGAVGTAVESEGRQITMPNLC